jgi:hypothetical protein
MASNKSIWYHVGHALERARHSAPERRTVAGLEERREGARRKPKLAAERVPLPSADDMLAAGVALVVDRVLSGWGRKDPPGLTRLMRAGAAGAAAALIADLVRPLVRGEPGLPGIDRATADRMLSGAAQGLLYGAVVEPRLPGHALVKGAVYASAEYWTDPMGGLAELLGGHAPHRHLPVLGEALDALGEHDRAYLEHLVFGIALALIYEPRSSSSRILPEDE